MKKIIALLSTMLVVAGVVFGSPFTYEAHALTQEDAARVEEARAALQEMLAEREVMALVYLSDEYPVREAASYDSNTVVTVPSGQTVQIKDVVIDENYEAWEYVSLYYGEMEYQGYIPRSYLACSDEKFLEWETDYSMNPGAVVMAASEGGATETANQENAR